MDVLLCWGLHRPNLTPRLCIFLYPRDISIMTNARQGHNDSVTLTIFLKCIIINQSPDIIPHHFISTPPPPHPFLCFQEGLRTLCVAYKKLNHIEYEETCHLLNSAKLALQDRDKKLSEAYDTIERDFILLGATAVEDR